MFVNSSNIFRKFLFSLLLMKKQPYVIPNCSMSLVTVFGSFLAGATSDEGGGSIAFPHYETLCFN